MERRKRIASLVARDTDTRLRRYWLALGAGLAIGVFSTLGGLTIYQAGYEDGASSVAQHTRARTDPKNIPARDLELPPPFQEVLPDYRDADFAEPPRTSMTNL